MASEVCNDDDDDDDDKDGFVGGEEYPVTSLRCAPIGQRHQSVMDLVNLRRRRQNL